MTYKKFDEHGTGSLSRNFNFHLRFLFGSLEEVSLCSESFIIQKALLSSSL